MQSTHEFRSQIESMLSDLSRIATQVRLGSEHNGDILRPELLELAEKLRRHHQLEAEVLYPELTASKKGSLRRAAAVTNRRLTSADELLERFLRRWSTPAAIDAKHQAFADDALRLVTRLRETLQREPAELLRWAER